MTVPWIASKGIPVFTALFSPPRASAATRPSRHQAAARRPSRPASYGVAGHVEGFEKTALPPAAQHVAMGRVEMWRGGCRLNISVAASFVWRCLSGSAMTPFPHPAHRTGHADLPHPALGQDLTPLLACDAICSFRTPIGVDRLPNLQVPHHVVRLS